MLLRFLLTYIWENARKWLYFQLALKKSHHLNQQGTLGAHIWQPQRQQTWQRK